MVVSPSGIASSIPGPATVETAKEVGVHYEDTAPQAMGSPTRNAFQQDLIVIRLRAWAAWAALPGAVQAISDVAW
jgi:hypothetical protein